MTETTGTKAEVGNFLTRFSEFFNGEILRFRKYLRDLSKGNSKKVRIVAGFNGNPEVIILEKSFSNLDPFEIDLDFWSLRIKKINNIFF